MARLFEQAQITLGSSDDVSGDIHGVELLTGRRSPVDVTGLSDTFDQYLVPNLRNWSVRLDYFNSFSCSSAGNPGINKVLNVFLDSTGTSGLAFTLRATTNSRSETNPEWTGQVQIDGEFTQTAGDVAEADRGSVTLKGLGVLQVLTSST